MSPPGPTDHRGRWIVALVVVFAVAIGGAVVARPPAVIEVASISSEVGRLALADVVAVDPAERTVDPYRGLGTWVDVFDYSPDHTGGQPPLLPTEVAEMAVQGVQTVFLQATNSRDPAGPEDLLNDRWALAEFLFRAHEQQIAVVGWFLPIWREGSSELDRLVAMAEFDVFGHRFDGLALDIEWNADGLDPEIRGERLVALSTGLRSTVGDDVLAAIVMPPVLTEQINPDYWPQFPWATLAPLYDVWMPMSYWSFRSEGSGWNDGYLYNAESTRLLRELVGDPEALIHGIGGIGASDAGSGTVNGEPVAGSDQLEEFVRSLTDTGSVGGSVYDWRTLDGGARTILAELFESEIPG